MPLVTLNAKEWLKHLVPLIELPDVVIRYGYGGGTGKGIEYPAESIEYTVAFNTHYYNCSEVYPTGIQGAGSLTFSDIPKAVAFLKKCKTDDVTIKNSHGNRLMIQCGRKKMSIPCYDSITQQKVPTFQNLVNEMKKPAYAKECSYFGGVALTQGGEIRMNDILDIASLGKLVAKDSDFEVKMNQQEGEFAVKAFKTNSTSMFVSTELSFGEGADGTVTSNFGAWLLPCLNLLDKDIDTNVNMGNGTVLVAQQANKLLVVIDQE